MRKLVSKERKQFIQNYRAQTEIHTGPEPPDFQVKVFPGLGPDGFGPLKWGGAVPRKPTGHTSLATLGGTF